MGSAPPTRHQAETEAERRAARLAELVSELTGCRTGGALHAVKEHQTHRDALEVVAAAMVEVDAPAPERFRVTGFLRDEMLVVHGSLRRWDRLHPEDDRPEDVLVEDRVAQRFRRRSAGGAVGGPPR